MTTFDPDTQQAFFLPSAVRNRLGELESDPLFVGLAFELLLRKQAHRQFAAVPHSYIRRAYGRRVHEAMKELCEYGFVQRRPYLAPTSESVNWNWANGYITSKEKAAIENGEREGRCYSYKIDEHWMERSEWVVHKVKKSDVHGNTWNRVFDTFKAEWDAEIEADESIISALNGVEDPDWRVLSLVNHRLTYNWQGDTIGRRYTTFNTMKSEYRQYFRVGGERLVELDLSSSVFYHLFATLHSVRDAITNAHGYFSYGALRFFACEAKKRDSSLRAAADRTHHYYDGTKKSTDYRYNGYIDLSPFIDAATDRSDTDFYELLAEYMSDIYEHPTRELAKTQANCWVNQDDYVTYERGGETKTNWKRHHLQRKITTFQHKGSGIDTTFRPMEADGVNLMEEEARMMLGKVQPEVEDRLGTTALTCHDALYVPASKAKDAKRVMKEVYNDEYGVAPDIAVEA